MQDDVDSEGRAAAINLQMVHHGFTSAMAANCHVVNCDAYLHLPTREPAACGAPELRPPKTLSRPETRCSGNSGDGGTQTVLVITSLAMIQRFCSAIGILIASTLLIASGSGCGSGERIG